MRFSLIGLWLWALPALAADPISFVNDREGESFYSSHSDKRVLSKATRQVDASRISDAFDDVIKDLEVNKLCSFDLNSSLNKKLKELNPKFSELSGAIIYLRTQNEIDDMVAKILLDAHKTVSTGVSPFKNDEHVLYPNEGVMADALKVVANFEKRNKSTCFDEAYRSLYGEVLKFDRHMKSGHVETIFAEAFHRKLITFETYQMIERARINEVQNSTVTLKSHYRKIQSLRTQFPLREPDEKSNFVTGKVDKVKMSRRQRLLENYTDIQIILMANVVKKLRTRLESPRAEILIYDRNQGVETIALEPMERFRLAIKLLRKEMSLLSLNTFFAGRSPDYFDLMSAAYETGVIPASELEEVATLEEIWNPKKTFWEKAQVWVRTLSSVATIAIPPPYGFIPALAVVVIEMTAGKKDDNTNDPTVLF